MGINDSSITPTEIEALDQALRVQWSDGVACDYLYTTLRRSCRCANCVEEMTGRPLLDPESVPGDVHPVDIRAVGQYAIQIAWSDGHGSGIYSYSHLRDVPSTPVQAGGNGGELG